MKKFLLRLSLAASVAFLALVLGPSMHAQQADQDPAPASPHQSDATATQQPQQNEAQMPASGDITTHQAKTFSGRIVKENGEFVLEGSGHESQLQTQQCDKGKAIRGQAGEGDRQAGYEHQHHPGGRRRTAFVRHRVSARHASSLDARRSLTLLSAQSSL